MTYGAEFWVIHKRYALRMLWKLIAGAGAITDRIWNDEFGRRMRIDTNNQETAMLYNHI